MGKRKELGMRLQLHENIGKENTNLTDDQRRKWKVVLVSMLDVIIFLSKKRILLSEDITKALNPNTKEVFGDSESLAKCNPVLSRPGAQRIT